MITCHDSPRPTRSPNRRAMYWSSNRDVSADSANTNGPMCSLRTYRLIIFTRGLETAYDLGTSSASQGCTTVYRLYIPPAARPNSSLLPATRVALALAAPRRAIAIGPLRSPYPSFAVSCGSPSGLSQRD